MYIYIYKYRLRCTLMATLCRGLENNLFVSEVVGAIVWQCKMTIEETRLSKHPNTFPASFG